jgi:hypothetical protein
LLLDHRLRTTLVQPRNQKLLRQLLRSSSSVVAAAAADTLQQLWRSICFDASAAATAPAHAAALQQALLVLRKGSDRVKASAAEFCWLASTSDSDVGVLAPQVVPVLTAALDQAGTALDQAEAAPWVVFALAALCNMRQRVLQDPAPVLQLWLDGDEVLKLAEEPLREAQMAEAAATKPYSVLQSQQQLVM